MTNSDNPFAFLLRSQRPDDGDEPTAFTTLTLHRLREESIQLRVRQHRDGVSAGWHVIMPSGELDVFPTPEGGLFQDERDAHLYALGEILAQRQVKLSRPATQAVQLTIAQWRQIPLF